MAHLKNIEVFLSAASWSASPLVKAYCGLVVLELTLKGAVALGNHDVPSALTRLNTKQPKPAGYHLLSLAAKLRTEIDSINVTGKDGERRKAPHHSYPFIRYTTFDTDGWALPATTEKQMAELATTVMRIQQFLKMHYGFKL